MIGDSAVRPWGSWQVLDEGDGFKVKRIVVEPGCRLSYQTHEHRAEHWTVVSGVATCVVDGEVRVLHVADSVNVAIGEPHRITNEHDEPLDHHRGAARHLHRRGRHLPARGRLRARRGQLDGSLDSLSLGGVGRLGRRLVGAPPLLVVGVPVDRPGQAGLEVAVRTGASRARRATGSRRWRSAGRDRAGRRRGRRRPRRGPSGAGSSAPRRGSSARRRRRPGRSRRSGRVRGSEHRGAVVVDVDPVAHVGAGAVDPRSAAVEEVGDLAGDELLDVLPGTVVVGAARDRRPHAEAADPRPHQVVGARLGGRSTGLLGR